ncbi:GspE/PulE family protein [Thauera linaloolentis]|uniref:Type II secretion system protein E n=1 Tax=Thauera linaloolentis (strain DSM 12138 / JCM 21573 / CCUG 41526 / CIP 105981 / IAM 15112 / NBRC 102519 / 47Lol) TaxID=1123367 RepID=N6Z461_THAL4|nr:GspE/PulE family protein [Thauera linaloolentis]ENO89223.1 type II secretion system protein E [Thauera linaloolentis 47Lol = DSM 12138]MCM8564296.1 GspE/PulE family protein [Thauera linaloolentis]
MNAPLPIGQLLLDARLIGADQLRIALHEQQQLRRPLGQVLVELGFVSDSALRDVLATRSGHPSVELGDTLADPAALTLVPQALARRHRLLPLQLHKAERLLVVATANAHDVIALDRLQAELGPGIRVELRIAADVELERAIERHYGQAVAIDDIVREIEQRGTRGEARAGAGTPRDGQAVVRLVDAMLAEAAVCGASDIHFEPEAGYLRIRQRIDGTLRQVRALHKSFWPELAVRLKVMAGLDIAESRSPQDGRISLTIAGRPIDFRVATQPTLHGENIVLRILDREKGIVPLDALGLSTEQRITLDRMLARPEGLILVCGPTGSGKTTTLYSILSHLNTEAVNIMTLEDPVEYPLAQIRQTPIGDSSRLGFADGVRALLRQDPDILLVGEIRDADTAQMALRAALTGHQVFATLHANSALGAIPRLLDIGLRADLLAGSLSGIIAQRLVRRLCPECRIEAPASPGECRLLGLPADAAPPLFTPSGCIECGFHGYRGRRAIMELLHVDAALDEQIAAGAGPGVLRAALHARGHLGLADDGVRRVLDGTTSLAELARVVDLASHAAARGPCA